MGIEREAHLRGAGQRALEYVPGISHGRFSIGGVLDVAKHARRGLGAAAPGQELKGRGIGHGEQVTFVSARQTLDRAPVEADALAKRTLNLCGSEIATDFSVPATSVNHSRTKRTPRSSMVRRTKSRCLLTPVPFGSV